MRETKEMKKYIRVVGILGIIQAVLLTLVWLYFYRIGHDNPAKEGVSSETVDSLNAK